MGHGFLLCEKIHPNLEEVKQIENKSAMGLGRGEGWEPKSKLRTCVTGRCCRVLEQPDCLLGQSTETGEVMT